MPDSSNYSTTARLITFGHVSTGMSILDKLTSRNIIALATVGTFLGAVTYVITSSPEVLENPLITGILGAFTTLTVLVYQFYFRKASPEE